MVAADARSGHELRAGGLNGALPVPNHALILTLTLSAPAIIAATAVGIIVGLIQALTQIQDQTLPMAVKLAAVGAVLMILGGGLAARRYFCRRQAGR